MLEPAQGVRYLKASVRDTEMQAELLEGGGFIRRSNAALEKKKPSAKPSVIPKQDEPKAKKKDRDRILSGNGLGAVRNQDSEKNYFDIHKGRISKMFQPLTLSRRNSPKASTKKQIFQNVFLLHKKTAKGYCHQIDTLKSSQSPNPKKPSRLGLTGSIDQKGSQIKFEMNDYKPSSLAKGCSLEKSNNSKEKISLNNSKSIGLTFRTASSRREDDYQIGEKGDSYAKRLRSSSLLQRAAERNRLSRERPLSISKPEHREVKSNLPSARGYKDKINFKSYATQEKPVPGSPDKENKPKQKKESIEVIKSWDRGFSQEREKSHTSESYKKKRRPKLSGKISIPQLPKENPKISITITKNLTANNCFAYNNNHQKVIKRRIESQPAGQAATSTKDKPLASQPRAKH